MRRFNEVVGYDGQLYGTSAYVRTWTQDPHAPAWVAVVNTGEVENDLLIVSFVVALIGLSIHKFAYLLVANLSIEHHLCFS